MWSDGDIGHRPIVAGPKGRVGIVLEEVIAEDIVDQPILVIVPLVVRDLPGVPPQHGLESAVPVVQSLSSTQVARFIQQLTG